MKIIMTLLFTLLCSSTLSADKDWFITLDKSKEYFLLMNKENPKLFTQVESSGGEPIFYKEERLTKSVSKVIYNSGTAGTSHPITIYRAVLFDKKSKKFLGDFPYFYRSAVKKTNLPQPEWKLKGKTLVITDISTDEVFTVEVP